MREEVLEKCFTELLKAIRLDREVVEWVGEALRQSHVDEKKFHEEAIARLEAEYKTLQNRLDQMYLDKLDGRIDAEFFDRKAAEWRAEQERVRRTIREHEGASENYMESGVRLLKLASRAAKLFQKQKPSEKRRLLNFVLLNCTWKDGQLHATFRQPFDMLAVTTTVHRQKKAAGAASKDLCPIWLPALDSNSQQDGEHSDGPDASHRAIRPRMKHARAVSAVRAGHPAAGPDRKERERQRERALVPSSRSSAA